MRVVRVLNRAGLNCGSEVPESAGLRSANYGAETLPSIGKGCEAGNAAAPLGRFDIVDAPSKRQ
jgi:hypothetical protein